MERLSIGVTIPQLVRSTLGFLQGNPTRLRGRLSSTEGRRENSRNQNFTGNLRPLDSCNHWAECTWRVSQVTGIKTEPSGFLTAVPTVIPFLEKKRCFDSKPAQPGNQANSRQTIGTLFTVFFTQSLPHTQRAFNQRQRTRFLPQLDQESTRPRTAIMSAWLSPNSD